MWDLKSRKLDTTRKMMRSLPYVIVGALIFSFHSSANLNDFLSVYLILLEAKISLLLIYWLSGGFKSNKNKPKPDFPAKILPPSK